MKLFYCVATRHNHHLTEQYEEALALRLAHPDSSLMLVDEDGVIHWELE